MRRPVFALLLAATCAGAAAQTPLERCQSITNSLERLRCYDALQAEPGAAPEGAKPVAPAESAKPAAPAETAAFRFRGSFDGAADCNIPFGRRAYQVKNIPIHGDVSGNLKPDKTGTIDLKMTMAYYVSSRIHFGGVLGETISAPGGTARAEIAGPNHLRLTWDLPNNIIVVEVDVVGQTCKATMGFELKPGKTQYTLHDGRQLYVCSKPRVVRTACRIR